MASVTKFGVLAFSIDGSPFDVADDLEYAPPELVNTSLNGMTGALQGISVEPKPGYIETTLRNNSGIPASYFNTINGSAINVSCRDGSNIIATGAVQTGEYSVNQKDGTIKVRFECATLIVS